MTCALILLHFDDKWLGYLDKDISGLALNFVIRTVDGNLEIGEPWIEQGRKFNE